LTNLKDNEVQFEAYNEHGINLKPLQMDDLVSCCNMTIYLLWSQVNPIKIIKEDHYRLQYRDPCFLAELWLDVCFSSVKIVGPINPNCNNTSIVWINQEILSEGVKDITNPFLIEWYLRNVKEEEFYIVGDDMFPGNKVLCTRRFIYHDFLIKYYTKAELLHINTIKLVYKLGDNFVKVPKHWPLHGPQLYNTNHLRLMYEMLKPYVDKINIRRGINEISAATALGALEHGNDNARFNVVSYFYYTNTNNLFIQNQSIPISHFYCINDGRIYVNWNSYKDFIIRIRSR